MLRLLQQVLHEEEKAGVWGDFLPIPTGGACLPSAYCWPGVTSVVGPVTTVVDKHQPGP